MKSLLTLWVLIFIQWQAFSFDCNLTFNNKTPSHIMSQMEEIYLMNMETGLVCFHELKNFLIEPIPVESKTENIKDILDNIYGNNHQENMERIQYLMSLLMENTGNIQKIAPRMHPEVSSQQMFPMRTTVTQITQTPSITGKPVLPDDRLSDLDKQVKQLQPQQQMPMLWNPYFFLPLTPSERDLISQRSFHTPEAQGIKIDTLNVDSTMNQKPKQSFEEEYVWTETFHIEFPAISVCKKPADEMSKLFQTTFKNYQVAIVEFTDSHTDMELIYVDIMEWLDSIRNQNGYNLQNTHPFFDVTAFSAQLNQIPDFIMDGMTPEQKENFNHMMDLIRKYIWMYNLYFEYRKCLPTLFREHLLFSYSVPVPLEITPDSQRLSEDNLDISLSDINFLYEFSAYTAPFVSPFKQNYPLRLFRQNNVSWNDFTSNDLRSRYEPEWQNTLEFLKYFISRNRMHLDVSF